MAKAEKIYDIAEKLGYEGDTGGNTSDAINAVSDALGFDGPHKGRITSALTDLYTVVSGGGGGGVNVGPGMVSVSCTTSQPVVGSSVGTLVTSIRSAYIGDNLVYQYDGDSSLGYAVTWATGVTIHTPEVPTSIGELTAYAFTTSDSTFSTLREVDIHATRNDTTYSGITAYYWSFDIPELEEGELLLLYPHASA